MSVTIPVSWGELLDKITILAIKREHIADGTKLLHIDQELSVLQSAWARRPPSSPEIDELARELHVTNEALWDIEDAIRCCERERDFSRRFIELARSVYRTNDRRAALKHRVNQLLGSAIVEEKSYEAY